MLNRRLRVTMVSHGYYPRIGGAERQLASLAPVLKSVGVDVSVITRRDPGLPSFEKINGIPVYRLPIVGSKVVDSLAFTFVALRLLRQIRPDVIHAHGLLSPTTTALAAKRLFGTPVVAKILSSGKNELGDINRFEKKIFGKRRLAKVKKNINHFVAISGEIDEELATQGILKNKRSLIPNGVNTTHFAPLSPEKKRSMRHQLGLPDVPLVIFIGRLAQEKRIDHLLSIWPTVRQHHSTARLLLVGAGPEEDKLRQLASDGVEFVGGVDDVAPYLQAADLFVLPSAIEGLSNAMLEALATGLPVIVSQVGGASDVISHDKNGWLIPPDDLPALQEALLTLLSDPPRRARLGEHGRESVMQDYALPVIASRLRDLYLQLLAT